MFLPFTTVFASLITSLGDPARCAIPQSQTDRATALIRQLDDDDKVVRDRASAGLAALKRQALPAIRHALGKQPSVEVKRRIRELLPRIRLDDFAARSPVFVWDLYGRYTHTFAVWDEYRAVTGDTPEARKLLRRILAAPDLRERLLSAATGADRPTDTARFRWWMGHFETFLRQQRMRKFDINDGVTTAVSGLLTESLLPESEQGTVIPHVLRLVFSGELGTPMLKADGPFGKTPTAVLEHWITTRTNEIGIRDAEHVCHLLDFGKERELSLTAKRVALKDSSSTSKLSGMSRLVGSGDKKYLPVIRALLTDTSTVEALGKAPEREVRDCALAMCLVATGQPPAEYGFVVASDLPGLKAVANNYWFEDDKGGTAKQKREAAFAKWDKWVAKNMPDEKKK